MKRYNEPIPDMTKLRAKRTAARYPLRLDAPENNERAVDVRLNGIMGENYYYREDNPPYWHRAPGSIPELYVREGILARLSKVNDLLSSLGYELFLFGSARSSLVSRTAPHGTPTAPRVSIASCFVRFSVHASTIASISS
jgi:hypothetical protein